MGISEREKDETLDTRDLILSVVTARKGWIRGRTVLQKLCYFVDEMLGLRVEYEPYFYGPYSEDIAVSVDSLVALDFLDEESETLPSSIAEEPQFDKKVYTYRLSDSGKRLVEGRKECLPIYEQTETILRTFEQSGMNLNDANMLSVAAKTYHILKEKGRPLDNHEISQIARGLGWTISEDLVDKVAESMKKTGLVKSVSEPSS